jgi:hypothetical protein
MVARLLSAGSATELWLDAGNDYVWPETAWHAANATKPDTIPENGLGVAAPLPKDDGPLEPSVRPERAQAPLFLVGLVADGSQPGMSHH